MYNQNNNVHVKYNVYKHIISKCAYLNAAGVVVHEHTGLEMGLGQPPLVFSLHAYIYIYSIIYEYEHICDADTVLYYCVHMHACYIPVNLCQT